MKTHLLLIFFLLFFLLFCLSSFAQTVAMFDFDCDDKDFEKNISVMTDLLIHEIIKSGDVTVERKRLEK